MNKSIFLNYKNYILIFIGIIFLFAGIFFLSGKIYGEQIAVIITITVSVILILVISYTISIKYPKTYRIAVIGMPQSGRTTLITTMAYEISDGIHIDGTDKVLLKGIDTMERVRFDIEKLSKGKKLKHITDEEVFKYRLRVVNFSKFFKLLIKQVYQLEILDFPTINKKLYTEEFKKWIHKMPYFNKEWVMTADIFIFVLDIDFILEFQKLGKNKAEINRIMKGALDKIIAEHYDGMYFKKNVLLVFTKTDRFINHSINETERAFNFGKPIQLVDKKKKDIDEGIKDVTTEFSELIDYFKQECNRFDYLFVSCFSYTDNSRQKFRIKELVEKILPK